MKITELETIVIQQPGEPRVIEDSIHRIVSGRELIVRLHTESGLHGSFSLSIGAYGGELTRQLFEVEMRRLVVGQDASMPRRLRRHLFDQTEYYGTEGLGVFGISVVEYCVWDILGKAADRSVAQLLGQFRTEIPAYGMVGWLNYPVDELVAQCRRTIDNAYRAVKIKVGAPELAEDLRRIEAVRDAVGPDVDVMIDANQILPLSEAIRRGLAYMPYNIYWYEEPMRPWMKDEYAELKSAVNIPIATGENAYGRFSARGTAGATRGRHLAARRAPGRRRDGDHGNRRHGGGLQRAHRDPRRLAAQLSAASGHDEWHLSGGQRIEARRALGGANRNRGRPRAGARSARIRTRVSRGLAGRTPR